MDDIGIQIALTGIFAEILHVIDDAKYLNHHLFDHICNIFFMREKKTPKKRMLSMEIPVYYSQMHFKRKCSYENVNGPIWADVTISYLYSNR